MPNLKEEILKGLNSFTHYYRSKFSKDCSRGETEDEMNTEMLEADAVKSFLSSKLDKIEAEIRKEYTDKIKTGTTFNLDAIRKETIEAVLPERLHNEEEDREEHKMGVLAWNNCRQSIIDKAKEKFNIE